MAFHCWQQISCLQVQELATRCGDRALSLGAARNLGGEVLTCSCIVGSQIQTVTDNGKCLQPDGKQGAAARGSTLQEEIAALDAVMAANPLSEPQ